MEGGPGQLTGGVSLVLSFSIFLLEEEGLKAAYFQLLQGNQGI